MAPFERIRRFATGTPAAPISAPPKSESGGPKGKPLGRSGTVNTRGFIQDREFNPLLIWPRNLDVYEIMSETDPTVRWMLGMIEYPVRAAEWSVEPATKAPEHLEHAAFIDECLFEQVAGGWDDVLRRILHYLRYGHSVFEKVAELREVTFAYDEEEVVVTDPVGEEGIEEQMKPDPNQPPGDPNAPGAPQPSPVNGQVPPPIPPPEPKAFRKVNTTEITREAFVLKRLAPRLPRTIIQWKPDEQDPSQLGSIVQSLADGQEPSIVEIPADRLVVFSCDVKGDDWRGISILRSAWMAYEYRQQLENAEAIGLERSVGLPVVYPPAQADDSQRDSVESGVKAMRQGENLYLIMPGPKAGTLKDDENGWLVEDLVVRGEAGIDFSAPINRYDSQLARNVLAEFMRLGHERVGSRATGDVQQDPYYMALEAVAGYVEEVVNGQVIKDLIDWNYGPQKQYPKLKADKLIAKALEVLATALGSLVPSVIEATPELEAWARQLLGAPEKPLELDEAKAMQPGATPGQGPTVRPDQAGPGGGGGAGADGGGGGQGKPDEGAAGAMDQRERFDQFIPPRPLTDAERNVNWTSMAATLDNGADDLVAIAERTMAGQIQSASSLADEAISHNDPGELDRVALDPTPLADAIEAELTRLYATGRADVRAEVRKMLGSQGPGEPMQVPKIPLSASDIAKAIRAAAQNLAETASQAAVRAIKARAIKTITQREETPPAPGEDPLAALRAAVRQGATPAVNRTYTLGRMDEIQAQAHAGFVDAVQYSAILDERTCPECDSWDGEVASPDNLPVDCPNPLCAGGDLCRCQWVPTVAAPSDLAAVG